MSKVERIEKKILWISFLAGVVFAIVEVFMGFVTKSHSVMMDGLYDGSELIVIGAALLITPLMYKPITEKRPFGYLQVESIFVVIKSIVMLIVSATLFKGLIESAFSGGNIVDTGEITILQSALGTGSVIIYFTMKKINKNISSPTIKSELIGWKMDVVYSLGMAGAFLAATMLKGTKLEFLMPYADTVIAIGIVVCTVPETIRLIRKSIKDVFLFAPEQDLVDDIKNMSSPILKEHKYEPVFYDITRTGRKLWVSIYFSQNQDSVNIKTLGDVTRQINNKIKEKYKNSNTELIIDTECMP